MKKKFITSIFLLLSGLAVSSAHAQVKIQPSKTLPGEVASIAIYWKSQSPATKAKIKAIAKRKALKNIGTYKAIQVAAGNLYLTDAFGIQVNNHGYYVWALAKKNDSLLRFSDRVIAAMYRGHPNKFHRDYCGILAYGSKATCREDSFFWQE